MAEIMRPVLVAERTYTREDFVEECERLYRTLNVRDKAVLRSFAHDEGSKKMHSESSAAGYTFHVLFLRCYDLSLT